MYFVSFSLLNRISCDVDSNIIYFFRLNTEDKTKKCATGQVDKLNNEFTISFKLGFTNKRYTFEL